jgi:hypothetical protein
MNGQRPFGAMILPSGSSVGVDIVRQFGDFPIRGGVTLGHTKPGDDAHQRGFAGIRAERVMCDWVMRKARAR